MNAVNLIIALLGCLVYYRYAFQKQIIDIPNDRSSHSHTPVRGMGIVLIPMLLAFLIWNPQNYLLVSGLIIAAITGYADDIKNLKRRVRLTLYLLSLCLALADIRLLLDLEWYWLMIAAVVALGVINAYNFMDGINGITGLYSMVFFASVLWLSYRVYIPSDIAPLCYTMLAFYAAFGVFNYRSKALAFLGDAGSVATGLAVVYILVRTGVYLAEWKIIIFLAVYGVDSVATIVLRLLRKENIFQAHRSHLYQNLTNEKGWSHLQVASLYALLQLLINLLAVYWLYNGYIASYNLFWIIFVLTSIYLLIKHRMNLLAIKISK